MASGHQFQMERRKIMLYTKDHTNIFNDPHTTIGDYTYGPISIERAYDGAISKFTMGKFCSLGQGIRAVYFGSHQLYDITTYPFFGLHGRGWPPVSSTPVDGQNIVVGNDVYIANNAIIMQGARIDDGAVIGAFSVVKTHIPAYHIYVGNPARLVRKRFNQDKIDKLLEIKWWDWPIEKVKEHLQIISSPDIDRLYEIYKTEFA